MSDKLLAKDDVIWSFKKWSKYTYAEESWARSCLFLHICNLRAPAGAKIQPLLMAVTEGFFFCLKAKVIVPNWQQYQDWNIAFIHKVNKSILDDLVQTEGYKMCM